MDYKTNTSAFKKALNSDLKKRLNLLISNFKSINEKLITKLSGLTLSTQAHLNFIATFQNWKSEVAEKTTIWFPSEYGKYDKAFQHWPVVELINH